MAKDQTDTKRKPLKNLFQVPLVLKGICHWTSGNVSLYLRGAKRWSPCFLEPNSHLGNSEVRLAGTCRLPGLLRHQQKSGQAIPCCFFWEGGGAVGVFVC